MNANPKHYSNTKEAIKVTNDVVIPYIKRERARLSLDENQTAILITDVFRGQMTNEVISLLKENNIILIRVPANMTHIFQPLDLTVNQWAKKIMRDRFSQWYAGVIRQHLDEGKILEEVEIKFPLSDMDYRNVQ